MYMKTCMPTTIIRKRVEKHACKYLLYSVVFLQEFTNIQGQIHHFEIIYASVLHKIYLVRSKLCGLHESILSNEIDVGVKYLFMFLIHQYLLVAKHMQ